MQRCRWVCKGTTMRRNGFLLGLGLLLGLGVLTYAKPSYAQQSTAFQLQQFRPWGDPQGMFQTQSGQTLGQWNYMVGLYLNYGLEPLTFRRTGQEIQPVVAHQLGADIVGAIGFLSWLEMNLSIPMTLYQVGVIPNDASFAPGDRGRNVSGFAFSDIKVALKAQALREKRHFLNLGFQAYLGIPSGNKELMNGEDSVSFGVSVFANKHIGLANIALNLGYRYLPPTIMVRLPIQHELTYSLAASFRVIKSRLDVIGDLSGAVSLSSLTVANVVPLELYLGARVFLLQGREDLALNAGISLPLSPGYGAPLFRFLVGVIWAPQARDTDGDGLLDHKDRCPTRKGPVANQGCPWPDTDGDGLTDNIDKCPKQKGTKSLEGCPDTDGDGLSDNVDRCPKRKGPKENKGCPWSDNDKDGIPDREDKCPNKKGPKANKGCPWGDLDGDGLTDNIDKCPNIEGPKENNGCPDPDRDKDGVVDRLDKCPDVPGIKEKQGCPKTVLVQVTKKEIKILQKIRFRTGSARILRRSYDILNQVVSVMKSREKMEIVVEGHTDNVGKKRYNLRLSQRRANSVMQYLVKQGIAKERLKAKGFGMSQPLVPNITRRNRAKNRRVQFRVVAQ
ncbi:MAG: OmpA family protein [Deltaproteobacteria bacterium]|nr:MAG: OmpA family protein [Deltaproteobacteria bacterium]